MAKKQRNGRDFRMIKIDEAAVRELILEFFVENQQDLFRPLDDAHFVQPLLTVQFREDGGSSCCIYDGEAGILDLPDDFLENAPDTTLSVYSCEQRYRSYRLTDGVVSEVPEK